ncbi:MAG: hypothetical protein JJU20_00770, partial [Opitutales bacterium]|nr:hypothetical protein [Opitutales bacterium]
RHLSVDVDKVAALSEQGGVFITSESGLAVGDVDVSVSGLTATAGEISHTDEELSGLTTLDDGDIILVALTGSIEVDSEVSANGEGRVLLSAEAGALTVNADILSDTGLITLYAETAIEATESVVIESAADISLTAQTEGITLDGTVNITATDSSLRLAAEGSIELGNLIADKVSIFSATGSISKATGSTLNVDATQLRLESAGSIAEASRHLSIDVDVLTTVSHTGSIFLTAESGLTVGSVGLVVEELTSEAAVTDSSDSSQSGLSAGTNAAIVLTVDGSIEVIDAIAAQGSGSVRIEAVNGDLDVNANLTTAGGNIHLQAEAVSLNSNLSSATGTSVAIVAHTGSIEFAHTAVVEAAEASVALTSGSNIVLGQVTAQSLALVAGSDIIDSGSGSQAVFAENLLVTAGGAIASAANPLRTDVQAVAAHSDGAGVFLVNQAAIEITTVSVVVDVLNLSGTTDSSLEFSESGFRSSAEGDLILETIGGSISILSTDYEGPTVATGAAGNIRIAAGGSSADLTVEDMIFSDRGQITLLAGRDVTFASSVIVGTGFQSSTVPATISVEAIGGQVALHADSLLTSTTGSIRVEAAGDVLVGRLTADSIYLNAQGGSILHAAGEEPILLASKLMLEAQAGIGLADRGMQTNAEYLSARTVDGGIHLEQGSSVTVTAFDSSFGRFLRDGSVVSESKATDGGLVAGSTGDIVLQVNSGGIQLESDVQAGNEVHLRAAESILGSALIRAEMLRMHAGENINLLTRVQQLQAVAEGNTLAIDNARSLTVVSENGAGIVSNGTVELAVDGDLILAAPVVAEQIVTLIAEWGVRSEMGSGSPAVSAGSAIYIFAGEGIGRSGAGALVLDAPMFSATVVGNGSAYITLTSEAELIGTELRGFGNLYLRTASDLWIRDDIQVNRGSMVLRVEGQLQIDSAELVASRSIDVLAQEIQVQSDSLISAGTGLRMRAAGSVIMEADSQLSGGFGTLQIQAGDDIVLAATVSQGLLNLVADGDVRTASESALWESAQLRIRSGGSVGSSDASVYVETARLDVEAGANIYLRTVSGLQMGAYGLRFETATDETMHIRLDGGSVTSQGRHWVDRGTGTLFLEVDGDFEVDGLIRSEGGSIRIEADQIQRTGGESAIIEAPQGRITLSAESGIGSEQAPIHFVASELSAWTQHGSMGLFSTNSTTVVGNGLRIVSGSGLLWLRLSNGSLGINAAVEHLGTGNLSLRIDNGGMNMNPQGRVSTQSGSLTLHSQDSMIVSQVSSSGTIVMESLGGSIRRLDGFELANIIASLRPVLILAGIADLTVDADVVRVNESDLFRRNAPFIQVYLVFSS